MTARELYREMSTDGSWKEFMSMMTCVDNEFIEDDEEKEINTVYLGKPFAGKSAE